MSHETFQNFNARKMRRIQNWRPRRSGIEIELEDYNVLKINGRKFLGEYSVNTVYTSM
jgi:hypothetical protein